MQLHLLRPSPDWCPAGTAARRAAAVFAVCLLFAPHAAQSEPPSPPPAPAAAGKPSVAADATPAWSAAARTAARAADAAVRANNFTDAAKLYARAAEAAPKEPTLRLALGIALSAAGHGDMAVPQFRRAAQLADDDVVALMLLQQSLAESGSVGEASELGHDINRRFGRAGRSGLDSLPSIRHLNDALAQCPDSPMFWLLLGDALQLSEDWNLADTAYAEAHRRAPLWSKPLVNDGISLLAQNKTDDAIRSFTDAIHLDPGNAQAQVWEGEAERRAGHTSKAITTLQQIAARRELGVALREQASTSLGMAFANSGSFGQAISALGAAQELAPKDPAPAAALGEVKLQAGDYKGAANAYNVALSLTREGGLFAARPMLYRALAEAQLTDKRPTDALDTLHRAFIDEPNSAPLWHRLSAQALFAQGREDDGIGELCTSIELEPDGYPRSSLTALAARGLLTRVRKQYEDALAAARQPRSDTATSADDPALRPLCALASFARYEGRARDEVALRREIVARRGGAADWYLLGETCDLRAGDPPQAREAYRTALARAAEATKSDPTFQHLTDDERSWCQKRLKLLTGGGGSGIGFGP